MYNHPNNMPYWPPFFPWNSDPVRPNQVSLCNVQKVKKFTVGGKDYTNLEDFYSDPGRKEPLIGMKYAVHADVNNCMRSVFKCTLCDVEADLTGIVPHFLGFKHRKRYIGQTYPEMLKPSKAPTEKLSKWETMKALASKVESMEGIKEIKILHVQESGRQLSKDGISKKKSSCATNVPSVKASMDPLTNDEKSKDKKAVSCNMKEPCVTACKVLPTNDGQSKDEKIVSSSVEVSVNTSTVLSRNDAAQKKQNKVIYPVEKLPDVKKQRVVKYLDSFKVSSDAEAFVFLNLARNLSENLKKYRLQNKEVHCMLSGVVDNDNIVDSSGCDMQVKNSDQDQNCSIHGKSIHSTFEKQLDDVQITKGEGGYFNENLPRTHEDDMQVSSSCNTIGKRSTTLTAEMLDILKGKDVNTVLQILQHLAPHYPALQDVNLEIFAHILSGNSALDFDT